MGILGTLLTVVGAVVSLIPGFQPVGLALMAAGGVVGAVEAKREAKRQRRAQVDKYNAGLEDRLETIQAETAARRVVLGRVRVGGVIAFAGTTGANKEKLYLVVLLAGHRVQAIEDIWFDEQKLTLDGSGIVQDAPYMQNAVVNGAVMVGNLNSSGGATVALPNAPVAGSVIVKSVGAYVSGQGFPEVTLTTSVSGSTVTISGGQPFNGYRLAYQYVQGTPHARVYKFDGTQTTTPAVLSSAFPAKFTAAHKFSGQALIVLELTFNVDVFPRGIPKITATVAGALVDDPRSNLLIQSAAFDNAAWTKTRCTVTPNATTAPDGTATAEKLVDDTSNNSHFVSQTIASIAGGASVTSSIYAKAAGRTFLAAVTSDSAGVFRTTYFDLTSGSVGSVGSGHTASIQPAGNGWYRCAVTCAQAATTGAFTFYPGAANVNGSTIYLGDGTSGIFVWGAQAEQRAFATDYTATTTTARTPTTAFSENPALLLAHYAAHPLGGRLSSSAVNLPRLTAAANRCDETTSMYQTLDSTGTAYGPATATLFTAAIVAEADKRPADIMDELAEAMAGRWCIAGGELLMRAGELTDTVDTITEDWLAGGVQIRAQRPRQELANTIRGTFASVQQNWQPTQFPQVQDATMLAAHGGELTADVQFDAVTRGGQCQYLGAIMLRELRQGMVVTIVCNLRAYRLQVFDVVAVTLARYGWTAKLFEVTDRTFTADGGIKLTLRETAAGIFDQSTTFSSRDIAPNTDLPNPFDVPTITGLSVTSGTATALQQQDGTFVPRAKVSWTPLASANVLNVGGIEVRYGPPDVDETQWTSQDVMGADSSVLIGPLQDQTIYVFKARAKSPLVRGTWSTQVAHKVAVRGAAGQVATWRDGTGALAQWVSPASPALWDAGDPVSYALPVGSVGSIQLIDGSATTTKLADGATTTTKLALGSATETIAVSSAAGSLSSSGFVNQSVQAIPATNYKNSLSESVKVTLICTAYDISATVSSGLATIFMQVSILDASGAPFGPTNSYNVFILSTSASPGSLTISTDLVLQPGFSVNFSATGSVAPSAGTTSLSWSSVYIRMEAIRR